MKQQGQEHGGTASEAQRAPSERWRLALESVGEGLWDWDMQTNRVYYSHQWKAMLGYRDEEIGETLDEWDKRVHPADRAQCYDDIRKHCEGKTPIYSNEHRVLCSDGMYKWILDRGQVIHRAEDGTPLRMVGTHSDIQKRKEAEQLLNLQHDLALRLSATDDMNTAFQVILEVCTGIEGLDCGGVYLIDPELHAMVLACHRGLSAEFIALASFFPGDSPQAQTVFRGDPAFLSYGDYIATTGTRRLDDRLRALVVIPIRHSGQTIAALNLASHTTETISSNTRTTLVAIASQLGDSIVRLRAERSLRESENNLTTLFETVDDLLFILGDQGKIIRTNSAACLRLGYTPDELASMNVLQVHPSTRRDEVATVVRLMLAKELDVCQIPLITKSGDEIPVETRVVAGRWSGHDVLFGVTRDVTQRKKDQQALLESEEKYRALFTNEIYAIVIVSPDNLAILDVNDAFLRLYGHARPELIAGTILTDISNEPEATRETVKTTMEQGPQFIPLRYHRKKDGTTFPVELASAPSTWKGKKVLFAIMHDISDRIHAEQGIAQLLREKQVLLKEVHHRIKNNLMTVASLLSLEANASETRPARTVLLDARQRIENMAKIYDTVYRSTDYTTMGTRQYLTGIVDNVGRTFEGHRSIRTTADIADCSMDTKTLYPLGIIIYELITNAHKYAFLDNQEGVVSVTLKELQNDTLLLEVCDNGVGIPPSVIEGMSEGFGFSLIRIFLQQLEGTMTITGEHGTRVSIQFPR